MNKILQPLRFHTSASLGIAARHLSLGFNNIVPLIASRTKLIPFQVEANFSGEPGHGATYHVNCYAIHASGTIVDLSAYLTFKFGRIGNGRSSYDIYVTYDGNSTISPLRQGVYYLHVNLTGNNIASTHFYSDYFKVGVYDTVTIEYNNSYTFGNLWMNGFHWKASYACKTYDPGEFAEYSEVNKDDDNYDDPTYNRLDKLRAVSFLGDSNAFDAMKMAKICDSIYITDELGVRQAVEIVEVSPATQSKSNYLAIVIKFRVLSDSIISVIKQSVTSIGIQTGSNYVEVEAGEGITFDGSSITFDGQPVKFNQ